MLFNIEQQGGELMLYDYSKLDGIITEAFGSRRAFAKATGISEHSISLKMNGKLPWKQLDIEKACDAFSKCGKDREVVIPYFFILKVQN
jgi:hypothetical protein